MKAYKSYHTYLMESLKDPKEAAVYLDVAFEDGSPEEIVFALKNVAEARKDLDDSLDCWRVINSFLADASRQKPRSGEPQQQRDC